jgi:hypothetical protein
MAGSLVTLPAAGAPTPCPQGGIGAVPVTIDGVKIRLYSSEDFATTPATQKSCVFLEGVGTTPTPLWVDHQIEKPGGVVGPWTLLSSSSISFSGGAPVTCSIAGNVARTESISGGLPVGSITDACCFTWEAEPPGSCSELPEAGDVAHHTLNNGAQADMPILSYINVGGTTCGLIGLELLPVVWVLRRGRRRS